MFKAGTYVNERPPSYNGALGPSSLLEGIKIAFNELAISVNMKEGRIIALGNAEVDESTAFSPVDLGHDCSRLIRYLLRKYVSETLAGEDDSPWVTLLR